jgi:hypothetical protein
MDEHEESEAEENSPVNPGKQRQIRCNLGMAHVATDHMPSVLHNLMFPRLLLTHIHGCAGLAVLQRISTSRNIPTDAGAGYFAHKQHRTEQRGKSWLKPTAQLILLLQGKPS